MGEWVWAKEGQIAGERRAARLKAEGISSRPPKGRGGGSLRTQWTDAPMGGHSKHARWLRTRPRVVGAAGDGEGGLACVVTCGAWGANQSPVHAHLILGMIGPQVESRGAPANGWAASAAGLAPRVVLKDAHILFCGWEQEPPSGTAVVTVQLPSAPVQPPSVAANCCRLPCNRRAGLDERLPLFFSRPRGSPCWQLLRHAYSR